ncbi:hypothetical protein BST36_12195 [Mycolicibacterium moriokaense]|uniref:Uncharacterized protein n=1 Tax=Mycolicibacterium moriokaense TaxID=39691 RepID=A0AAD1H5K9_9MYCO|nr:hypothetical protein [Mycolicibacterium moriokaense]MCV7037699.1 hypothetical protein [Mycolicibacterium moriokaense]ORB23737.1 hypothetical protein BST36_12195 [Mycolicibacterium moriokaense]BBW99361.1 hypothetical protein MMOR_02980 [Mycolicibacterium moriokaense]
MNSITTRRVARFFALPVVSAGIIGGAALGLAGTASAGTYTPPRPSIPAPPVVKAHPAPSAVAGMHHDGIERVIMLEPGQLR